MKGDPLVGEIELGMNQGENSWDINKPIQGELLLVYLPIQHNTFTGKTILISRNTSHMIEWYVDILGKLLMAFFWIFTPPPTKIDINDNLKKVFKKY